MYDLAKNIIILLLLNCVHEYIEDESFENNIASDWTIYTEERERNRQTGAVCRPSGRLFFRSFYTCRANE